MISDDVKISTMMEEAHCLFQHLHHEDPQPYNDISICTMNIGNTYI